MSTETMNSITDESGSIFSFEVILTLAICALGAYYYLTKKKSNEFDVKSIKSFTVE